MVTTSKIELPKMQSGHDDAVLLGKSTSVDVAAAIQLVALGTTVRRVEEKRVENVGRHMSAAAAFDLKRPFVQRAKINGFKLMDDTVIAV